MVINMRIIAKFEKREEVRFISHLDVQSLFQRAFRRANLPVAYSQGFNPHSLLSFATALTVGSTSCAEWMEIKMEQEVDPQAFLERINAQLPPGIAVVEARATDEKLPTLSALMAGAEYEVFLDFASPVELKALQKAAEELQGGAIVVQKHTKAGLRKVDIRPQLYALEVETLVNGSAALRIFGQLDVKGSLNIALLLKEYERMLGQEFDFRQHRREIFSADGAVMPKLPERFSKELETTC